MPLIIPPNSTPEEVLRLARTQGRTDGTYTAPGQPGSINVNGSGQPNVTGQPGTNFETGQPTSPFIGPPQNGPAKTGPTVYDPAPGPISQSQGFDSSQFSMGNYLNNKLGPSTPYISSITSMNGGSGGPQSSQLGGGGGQGDYLTSILSSVKGQYDKANAANESRFAEAKNTLSGYGKGYQQQINEQSAQDLGKQEQDAVSRGLGNTTVRQGMISDSVRRKNDANLNLQDRLASAKVNLLSSKFDNAPDPLQYAALLQNATNGAYGSGNTLASIAAALGLKRA